MWGPGRRDVSLGVGVSRPHVRCVAAQLRGAGMLASFSFARGLSPGSPHVEHRRVRALLLPVFGVLVRIVATTTKICTARRSTCGRPHASVRRTRPPTRGGASARGYSAIHFRRSCIRWVRRNTFLSGCRPPWPPPHCPYAPAPSIRVPPEAPYPRARFIPLRRPCLPEPAH